MTALQPTPQPQALALPMTLELLLVHCQGEIGKVLVAGAPDIPGATMLDKMNHINRHDDRLRRFLTGEPRAHVAMSVNLLLPPTRPDADAGFIVLQSDRAHAMSGSNCICVVTALLETGRVPIRGPVTEVRLDTPAGLVVATARCEGGRCLSVSLDNVPCFAEALDREVQSTRWGPLRIDVAFGGVYYALVDVAQTGLAIVPEQARALAEAGVALRAELAGQVRVAHPLLPGVDEIAYVMFRQRLDSGEVRTCTTLPPGRVDRSPCGTGSSAHLATLFARGEVRVGDHRVSRSIIGGEFRVEAIGATEVAGRPAVLPRITGRGTVFGREQLVWREDEPFADGFLLSDTWGPGLESFA
ncbi:MAG: hypothetical protein RL654_1117 [Pseudomonadota bacterium]|jgi:proline racemase